MIDIPYKSLDEVVYEPDKSSVWGNKKRPAEERDRMFNRIVQQENWIVEDVGRPCFSEGLKQADMIILLEIPLRIRKRRIALRWIKQRLGIEKSLYAPRYEMLKCMLGWAKGYDAGKDELFERLIPYGDKLVVLQNQKETDDFIRSLQGAGTVKMSIVN